MREPARFCGRIWLLACSTFLLGPGFATAQAQPASSDPGPVGSPNLQAGISVALGAAVGEFADNVETAGGISGHFGVGLGESPLSLGGEISFFQYGSESRRVPLSPTIPDVLVTLTTANQFLLGHLRLRAQARQGRWRPYLDALFGFNYIFTDTSLDADGIDGPTSIATTTHLDDAGLSYGGGGGLMIRFGSPPVPLGLDIGVRFLGGSEANYLRKGAIRREDGEAVLDISRSRTDMVTLSIGATWTW